MQMHQLRTANSRKLVRRHLLLGSFTNLASCFVPAEDHRWRMVYTGGYWLKTVDVTGAEESIADWSESLFKDSLDRRTHIAGASLDGMKLLLSRSCWNMATHQRVEGDNGLLRYSLSDTDLAWLDCPLLEHRKALLGLPGIEVVMVCSVAIPGLRKSPIPEMLCKATGDAKRLDWWIWSTTKSSWVLFALGMDLPYSSEYRQVPPPISLLSATGRGAEVVYSREGLIFRHELGAGDRVTLGRGDFASVCPHAGIISWRTAESDIQIAEFPSMKPVRTLKGPFRDGILWCPNGKWGAVVRDKTHVSLGLMAVDELNLVHVDGFRLASLGSYRRQIGTSGLRWIDCSGHGLARLRGVEAVVLAPRRG